MAEPRTSPTLVEMVAATLIERGPMGEYELLAELEERGAPLGPDPEDDLVDALEGEDGAAVPLVDGRWAWLPALLAGRVLTHRVDTAEAGHDVLSVAPDLEPLCTLVEEGHHSTLADGTPISWVLPDLDIEALEERGVPDGVLSEGSGLLLPVGLLSGLGVAAGDLVSMRLGADGLELVAVEEEPPDTGPALARLGSGLRAVLDDADDEPVLLDMAIWTACADDPELFTSPLPPLTTAVVGCGLSWDGDWLAHAGFDFRRWRVDGRVDAVRRRHDLDHDEALAVLATVTLYHQVAELHRAAEAAVAGGDTDLTALIDDDGDGPGDTSGGAAALPAAPDEDEDAAAPDIQGAVRATAGFLAEPAVAEAVLAETIGAGTEGAAALGLFAETYEPLAPREARVALRWLRAKAYERLGEVTRAEDTYRDAQTLDPSWPPVLYALARYASDRGDAERGLALLHRAGATGDDPLVELLREFRPSPRRELGRNQPCWCGSGRKYKVCHSGRETLPLDERAAWLYQKASTHLLDGHWRLEVLELAAERARYWEPVTGLLDAIQDPLALDVTLFEGGGFADFLATRGELLPDDERLLGGQWLLVERSVYEVRDVRPGQGFDARDVRTGDVHTVRERTASRQLDTGALICARIVPAGETMQVFGGIEPVAQGQPRDELIGLLDAEPEPVELVAFLTRRFASPELQNTEGEELAICKAEALAPTDPELAPVLERFVRDYERSWLDQELPALSGCTPRQAASDPTRRDDLLQLLDGFPVDAGNPGLMNPDRLRAALDL